MEIKTFSPLEQIEPAVDLGTVPPPLPPPEIIEGVLHQGCEMILGGTPKSNKSWCLLDLAISVAAAGRGGAGGAFKCRWSISISSCNRGCWRNGSTHSSPRGRIGR
jgi:hypothetical protein